MKLRVLIAGSNELVKNQLFENMSQSYELVSTSDRYRDLDSHLRSFKPHLYVYCIMNENVNDLENVAAMHSYVSEAGAKTIVIGTEEKCRVFQTATANMAELAIDINSNGAIVRTVEDFAAGLQGEPEAEIKKKHVLVIDDDPQMLRVIKEMLHERYDVATAISGKIAYKFLEKKTTDLILLDFEMPDENGPQVLTRIRENPDHVDIPVFFLTGNTEREKIKEAMVMNPQGYLLKPIDRDSLIDSIKKTLGQ